MSAPADSLLLVAAWPRVATACAAAREAGTRLRFHEGLRRRIPEAAAESRVRGAWSSAALDGARVPVEVVRNLVTGRSAWPPGDATWDRVRGAVQVTAEAERVGPLLAAGSTLAPAQALARLHLAAAEPLGPASALGRPRGSAAGSEAPHGPTEFAMLPAPPSDPGPRLAMLGEVLAAPDVPALLVAALVHAEVALVRPFVGGNALVARAAERAVLTARGLDATGVAVPEFGHAELGPTAYAGALAAFATGSRDGLTVWIEHCGAAFERAVTEGERIADAVRAGRLG
ncbi:hypothetical protein BJY21_001340 [Kineosphaera limosa]|nr:hypothetical protein [Kineosphaera limosa]